MSKAANRPIIAICPGDPAGIGPEVTARAWAGGEAHKTSRPVVTGSVYAMEKGVEIAGVRAKVRKIQSLDEISDSPEVIDVMDSGALDPKELEIGKDSLAGGLASGKWMDEANALARSGQAGASVFAPISAKSLMMAKRIDSVIPVETGKTYLFLVSGPLRIMHLTDHMPLRKVCEVISEDLMYKALHTLDGTLRKWGIANPRIIVAGLNPHAQGTEETQHMIPAVQRAKADGLTVSGPDSPDAVFRHCIEGRYDAVLAMYHDQGHIPIKTWGFSGNCAMIVGIPFLNMTVAHGTAFDIAGKGIADHTMMQSAMRMAGLLAAGSGFE